MDLRSCFDEILQVSTSQEIAQVYKFAVVLILNVNDSPSVLAAADLLSGNDDGFLGADDSEGNNVLFCYQYASYLCC